MTDLDIILKYLARVGKSCLIRLTVIYRTGPAVGFDTHYNINRCHFECTTDVTNRIIMR